MLTALSILAGLALAINADPHPSDLWHFPGLEVCERSLEQVRAYAAWLENHEWVFAQRYDLYVAAKGDIQRRACVWAKLHECWLSPPDRRRPLLASLREELGPEDYHEGRMPSPFPVAGPR